MLKQSGFTSIYPVKDGVEARKLLLDQGENFDLLISDIEMPLLDGLSLVETLRQDERAADLVILFSSIMVKDLLDRAESLKIIHVLKPDVYKLVEEVMKIYHDIKRHRNF